MTGWEAPERPNVPRSGDERELLESWLDWHRATLLIKTAGLTGEQLCAAACPPSTLSLLGLVRHMAEVERGWFVNEWHPEVGEIYSTPDQPDADFTRADPAQAAADLAIYQVEVTAAREEAALHQLDELSSGIGLDGAVQQSSMRWIYLHMIEEYARHNGHADLLRQAIDGATGH